jgi:hypothetical protein
VCQLENDYVVVEGESSTKLLFLYLDSPGVYGLALYKRYLQLQNDFGSLSIVVCKRSLQL